MVNTLGCDSNHVGGLDNSLDDPSRGQILGLYATRRRCIVHNDTPGPHFHATCGGQQGDLLTPLHYGVRHHRISRHSRPSAQGTLQSASLQLAGFRQIIITRAGDGARLYFYVIGREPSATTRCVPKYEN
jgi:hypothetical protein